MIDPKISKITDPNKIGGRLMKLPTQEIVAFTGVFLWKLGLCRVYCVTARL